MYFSFNFEYQLQLQSQLYTLANPNYCKRFSNDDDDLNGGGTPHLINVGYISSYSHDLFQAIQDHRLKFVTLGIYSLREAGAWCKFKHFKNIYSFGDFNIEHKFQLLHQLYTLTNHLIRDVKIRYIPQMIRTKNIVRPLFFFLD